MKYGINSIEEYKYLKNLVRKYKVITDEDFEEDVSISYSNYDY
jgi:hypothetical protein